MEDGKRRAGVNDVQEMEAGRAVVPTSPAILISNRYIHMMKT